MLHWFFLTVKYQIWPLPKDAAQLTKLAIDLQVPRAHSETYTRLDTSLVRNNIIERLQSFRKDALYVFLLLVPIFFHSRAADIFACLGFRNLITVHLDSVHFLPEQMIIAYHKCTRS